MTKSLTICRTKKIVYSAFILGFSLFATIGKVGDSKATAIA